MGILIYGLGTSLIGFGLKVKNAMITKNIIKKNYFIVRQNLLAPFSRLGRKIMQAHVRIYMRCQNHKKQLISGGLGLIPWIKAHPILTAALAYGAYKA